MTVTPHPNPPPQGGRELAQFNPPPQGGAVTTYTPTIAYQLRDIHGLDPIPWWPPALGWWLLALGLILTLKLAWRFLPHLHSRTLTELAWRWDASRELHALRSQAHTQASYLTAKELSELLRRIAMARHGRAACAGLTGMAWLAWLESQDPAGYAWTKHGKLLLFAPYAPPERANADLPRLVELLDATKAWILTQPQPSKPQESTTHV